MKAYQIDYKSLIWTISRVPPFSHKCGEMGTFVQKWKIVWCIHSGKQNKMEYCLCVTAVKFFMTVCTLIA